MKTIELNHIQHYPMGENGLKAYIEEDEYWVDMLEYKGVYKISTHGRIKSLKRKDSIGRNVNGRMMSQKLSNEGYFMVKLYNKRYQVHQSMAESFLQTKTDGKNFVVNHIDHNKENNHLSNLEIVTPRQNSNKKHIKHSSKYTGVTWNKNKNKWTSRIYLNGKLKHLGHFDNEYESHIAYEKELEGTWKDINTL